MEFNFEQRPGRNRTRFYAPSADEALVSVITPFYNAGKYFEQTFNSVMNQTFPWFEWIIVDDGSTNREDVALLHALAAQDPRIRVETQENAGPSRARNHAVELSRTDLIVPLDADDLIEPTYLECLYWSLKYNPDAAWSYTNSLGFQEQEYVWKYPYSSETMKTFNFLNYTAMIRKQDFLDVGGYMEIRKAFHEDWKFWLDMLTKSKKPVRVNSLLFWYRRLNTGRMSGVNSDPELVKANEKIMEQAAQLVDTSVEAKIYPVEYSQYPLYRSKFQAWDRKVKDTHEKKRVMWLIPWMVVGGADKFDLDAIAGLERSGFENHVLMTEVPEQDHEWRQRLETHTDEVFCLPDFLDPAHYMEFISYYIQSREIDIIMLTNSYAGYYMMPWIRQHFPDVAIVDYVHMEEWYWNGGGFARTSGALSGITEKTYVCNSSTQRVMVECFGREEDSVQCLHIGVDHAHFDRKKEAPGYLHQLLNLEAERKIVLFPCRIHPQKRPFLMLEIAQQARKEIPGIAFVVVGDGPQLEDLKAQIQSRGLDDTVYCIGSSDKMRACYRDSDLTLICSLKEGLALTAYESLSMSVPVVSADVGGQRDLIGEDVGALLPLMQDEEDVDERNFSAEEIDQYVAAIGYILEDDARYARLCANCRSKIEAGFSIDRMVHTLSAELEALCADQQKAAKRRVLSHALQQMEYFAADYYAMYRQWGIEQENSKEVWRVRCWLEEKWTEMVKLYHAEVQKNQEVWEAKCWLESQTEQLSQELAQERSRTQEVWEAKRWLEDRTEQLSRELSAEQRRAQEIWEVKCRLDEEVVAERKNSAEIWNHYQQVTADLQAELDAERNLSFGALVRKLLDKIKRKILSIFGK